MKLLLNLFKDEWWFGCDCVTLLAGKNVFPRAFELLMCCGLAVTSAK
jgi:hypothetical protein